MQYGKKRELYKISERSFLSKFMKTAGIIAEYNPFHKGHEYQIRYTKEKLKGRLCDCCHERRLCAAWHSLLSSPNIHVQKWLCGAALTLYLKCRYPSLQQVRKPLQWEVFPLLDSLGVVDMLCFGSESGGDQRTARPG